jgi:mRNA interferase RelE/StbE
MPGVLHRALKGEEKVYRVRAGNYRIIYEVQSSVLMIYVIDIGDRKNVY